MKNYLFVLIVSLALLNCSKSTNDPQPTGPVTEEELKSISSLNLQQLTNAFDNVTKADPSLLKDEVALSRAVFNRLKENPNGRLSADQDINKTLSIFDKFSQLTLEEKIILFKNMLSLYSFNETVNNALAAAQSSFPCDKDVSFTDSKADALRHAYWNALMVRHINLKFAEDFSFAHEGENGTAASHIMDLHNNKFGRDFALKYPTATDEQLLTILTEQKFVYVKEGSAYPPDAENSLVYFKAKRAYDGTMTGMLTNPDSGGPWNLVMEFSQCGDVVRGQFTETRGSEKAVTRYSGKLDTNGTLIITAEEVYLFENPRGLELCRNMVMTLKGNENKLKGNWTSSNCGLGGVVDLSR